MPRADRSIRKTVAAASLLALALTSVSTLASADEHTRTITIHRVAGVSTSRPQYPTAQSLVRVYATTASAWGNSACRTDAADVALDDWHIFTIVMQAWKEQMPLSVVVESTARIDTADSVCKIVAVNPAI